jgi:hypothetical protein
MRGKMLPPKDSPQWRELVTKYLASTTGERNQMAEALGYAGRWGFMKAMNHRGVYLPMQEPNIGDIKAKEIERHPAVELPPINLLRYKSPVRRRKGDEEIAILHASDGHADKITKSYDKGVYKSRMGTMFESVMTIVNLHRNMYPIRKLIILNTGDNIQGENPYQGSTVGDVSMGARDQVKSLAAPMWNDVIGSFSQQFEQVEFHGVPGNHGHDRLAPETSSYDLLLYDVLESGIGKYKGISINVHDQWYYIKEIDSWRLFMFHGDGIPCQQGVPFFALDKKLKSWHMQFGGFNYAFGGHFHKRHSDEISSVLEYFMCGSLTSDDEWALKKLGVSSNPSQWIYGFHPRHGITWRYPVIVDYNFLPQPLKNDSLPVT